MNCDDPAQNRGGSRPFSETRQHPEFTYGSEMASTINTYAVMKSSMKNVDSTVRSGPIPSLKAQKSLTEYKVGAGDGNSKEVNGKVLYSIGGGMPHGRVLIANGAMNKVDILTAAKSGNGKSINSDSYRSVIQENEQLKVTNNNLVEKNELLLEENGVNRDLIMRLYADLNKEPPAEMLSRLANIDAHRHQVDGPLNEASHSVDELHHNDDTDDDILDDGDNKNGDFESDDNRSMDGDGGDSGGNLSVYDSDGNNLGDSDGDHADT